ncbi:MAG: phosphatidate cytidylyltransferase, partial [Pseudomonadota bacterium]|nr:phosphatidate cytidylyltransferase [Pseudomonadota bacterium]
MRARLLVGGGNLRARILTAAAMVPVVAAALYLGDWPLVVFLLAVSAGMGWEWGGLSASDSGPWPVRAAGAALTAALTAMAIAGVLHVVSPTVAAGAVVVSLGAAAVFTRRQAGPRPRLVLFGMPVLVVGCTAVAGLRGDDLA